jgi:hypothetical protein
MHVSEVLEEQRVNKKQVCKERFSLIQSFKPLISKGECIRSAAL